MLRKTVYVLASGCAALGLVGIAHAQDGARPKPVGNPGSWVTNVDYPASALQAHQEGTVEFALDLNAAGRPEHCTVATSSGVPVLDEATCSVMMARAVFEPLQPGTASHYRSRMAWRLPPVPVDDKGRPQLLVAFEFDRHPIRCSVRPRAERVYLPSGLCKQMGGVLHRGHALIGDPVYVTIDMAEQVLRRRL